MCCRRLLHASRANEVHGSGDDVVIIHPNFRVFALANRPGFPFLGEDFFRECGDEFSSHVIDNPDADSELSLVTQVRRVR